MAVEPNRIGGAIASPANMTKLVGTFSRGSLFVNGVWVGRVSGDALEISVDQNTAEVITGDGPQGTKPSETVVTGSVFTFSGALAANAVNLQSLAMLSDTVFDKNDGTNDAAYLGASLFVAKQKLPVKIAAINESSQSVSVNPLDILNLYEVEFTVEKVFSANGGEANTIAFTAMVYQKVFTEGEKYPNGPGSAAGYLGDPAVVEVPELVWPDKIPVFLDGVNIASATALTFTLSRNAKLATGQTLSNITIRDANGTSPGTPTSTTGAPTSTASSNTFTHTYAAGTFDANSAYTVTIPAGMFVSDIPNSTDNIVNIELKRRTTNGI